MDRPLSSRSSDPPPASEAGTGAGGGDHRVPADAAPGRERFRNALDAIGADGEIRVRWETRGPRTILSIEDTGGGIPADVKPHLFAPFFTSKENGQGIRLTLVQEILIGHCLDFSLQDSERGGAVFTIVF